MNVAQRETMPKEPASSAAAPFRRLGEVVAQVQFHLLAPQHRVALHRAPFSCSVMVVACFREDGAILMVQAAGEDAPWDLPHGTLPPGQEPGPHAGRLLAELCGVTPAETPRPFGVIDWGPAASAAGWGLTACLISHLGTVGPLLKTSWAARRAFFPLPEALLRAPPDPWQAVRRQTLQEANTVFDATRDYWFMQRLDIHTLNDPDDVVR